MWAILGRVGCHRYCWFQQTANTEQRCAPFLAQPEQTEQTASYFHFSSPAPLPCPPQSLPPRTSQTRRALCGSRGGDGRHCFPRSLFVSPLLWHEKRGGPRGGAWHTHSLVLSLITKNSTWHSALRACIWSVLWCWGPRMFNSTRHLTSELVNKVRYVHTCRVTKCDSLRCYQ